MDEDAVTVAGPVVQGRCLCGAVGWTFAGEGRRQHQDGRRTTPQP